MSWSIRFRWENGLLTDDEARAEARKVLQSVSRAALLGGKVEMQVEKELLDLLEELATPESMKQLNADIIAEMGKVEKLL